MTWLTWRQFRVQAITAAAALAAFAILLAATGPHLASLYTASGLGGCKPASCEDLAISFLTQLSNAGTYSVLDLLGVMIILLAPAVIGLFWGAPLIARELVTGTSALAWNQSVTRTRWLAVKLAVVGLAAMAVTLAIFAALQVAMPLWIRPHLFPAEHSVVSVASLDSLRPDNLPSQPGAWLLSSETVTAAGQPVTATPAACPAPPLAKGNSGADAEGAYLDCLASHGIREAWPGPVPGGSTAASPERLIR